MSLAAHSVQNDTGQGQVWVVITETLDESPQRCGLTTGIDHQHHRQPQLFCDSCRAAGFTAADAVEQTHDPLHQGQIPLAAVTVKSPFNPGFVAQVDVEIAAGMPCCSTQQLRIEVVRSNLERLDAVALRAGPGQQGQSEQRLAAAAGRCGDDNGHGRWCCVSSAAWQPAEPRRPTGGWWSRVRR